MDQPIEFDRKTYRNKIDIQTDLLAAAHGLPNTNDRDLIFDPSWWSHLFLDSLRGSFLQETAGQVLYEMAKSQELEVRTFAMSLLFDYPFASVEHFLTLLQEAYQKQEESHCKLLAFHLRKMMVEKRFAYPSALREFAQQLFEEFFLLYFIYDAVWLQQNLTKFFPKEEQEGIYFLKRVFGFLLESPFSSEELSHSYQQLESVFALLAKPVSETFSSLVKEAIAKKSR